MQRQVFVPCIQSQTGPQWKIGSLSVVAFGARNLSPRLALVLSLWWGCACQACHGSTWYDFLSHCIPNCWITGHAGPGAHKTPELRVSGLSQVISGGPGACGAAVAPFLYFSFCIFLRSRDTVYACTIRRVRAITPMTFRCTWLTFGAFIEIRVQFFHTDRAGSAPRSDNKAAASST